MCSQSPVPRTPSQGRTATPLGRVVPAPASVHAGGSPYRITDGTRIRVEDSPQARRVGAYLADVLRPSTGYRLPVTTRTTVRAVSGCGSRRGPRAPRAIAWTAGEVASPSPAAAPAGLFHGVQTLRQLLPAAVEKNSVQAGPWLVAGGTIKDSPRYGYRGAMLEHLPALLRCRASQAVHRRVSLQGQQAASAPE